METKRELIMLNGELNGLHDKWKWNIHWIFKSVGATTFLNTWIFFRDKQNLRKMSIHHPKVDWRDVISQDYMHVYEGGNFMRKNEKVIFIRCRQSGTWNLFHVGESLWIFKTSLVLLSENLPSNWTLGWIKSIQILNILCTNKFKRKMFWDTKNKCQKSWTFSPKRCFYGPEKYLTTLPAT